VEKPLNRSLMVITPRLPFATWAGSLASREDSTEVGELREDGTAYIVPPVRDAEGEDRILAEFHLRVFENELEACVKDPALWPTERNLDTFLEWFDVSFHDLVFDLGETLTETGAPPE
jgi:hypothetical protein